jgi:NADPH:quinone reductase-like Zn-dependent oxidoreductase
MQSPSTGPALKLQARSALGKGRSSRPFFRITPKRAEPQLEFIMTQQSQDSMQAAAIDSFGGPITPHTLPMPNAGPGEILIHVEAAGVGVWDPFEREGGFAKMMGLQPHFPYVLGSEGAGTVEDVGQQVHKFRKGDRVYAMALANPKGGFYAEYAAVGEQYASPIPDHLTMEQAGVMPVDAITALRGLDDAIRLQPGESILIFGASGGIGHMAVQLAKRMGAKVFAVASGSDGVALAERVGADAAVDGHKDDILAAARQFVSGGLDAALLTAGGKEAQRALEALRQGGRFAYPNGVEPTPSPAKGTTGQAYDGQPSPETLSKLNRLIEMAPFEVHVSRTFSLDQAAEAHRVLDEHFLGKIALLPSRHYA